MKKIILFSLCLIATSNVVLSQNADKFYRTEEGVVYDQQELDSIKGLGLPIGFIRDETINDTTFTIVQIYESLEALKKFTAKYQGEPLPHFTLKLLDGKEVNTKDLKGKVIMINFWSTTCGPCIKEIPELNDLQRDYGDKVVFLAPLPESHEETKKFLTKYPYHFAIAPDSEEVFEQLEIDGYPKNLFVDKNGIIQKVTEGTPQRRDSPDGEWYLSVYEDYSEILDKLITSH